MIVTRNKSAYISKKKKKNNELIETDDDDSNNKKNDSINLHGSIEEINSQNMDLSLEFIVRSLDSSE